MSAFNEIGQAALSAVLGISIVTALLPFIGLRLRDARLLQIASPLAHLQFILVGLSFICLMIGFAQSDFSLSVVWQNSHSDMPFIYKLTGTWGNHEGSMLLWILILVLFTSLVAFGKNLPLDLKSSVIAVQSWITTAFLLFLIFTSNPFERLTQVPINGQDLNPILQDIGLAIHPPLLYIGYVGFSITFSFAIAALILGRIDQAWAKWVRPWTLLAWMFLTLGIAMGSYWAYYELGWGGFWFWDPVENASLMPWIIGTALLHSAIVVEKRAALRIWTVLLAILTFSLSLLGTFLVRSGVLTSVHSFATDPTRGIFILLILMFFVGGGLALFALRANSLNSKGLFEPISREGGIILNNIFLVVIAGTVLTGTLYPLIYETFSGQKISVGAPFFNLTATPLFTLLALFMPIGQFLTWKKADAMGIYQRLRFVFLAAVFLSVVIWLFTDPGASYVPLALIFGIWLLFGAIWEPLWRAKLGRVPIKETVRRLIGLPNSLWGGVLGHAGLAITLIGIVLVTSFSTEQVEELAIGDSLSAGGYEVTFQSVNSEQGPNYLADIARLSYSKNGYEKGALYSEKRIYPTRNTPTTEAGIATHGFSQIYVSLGEIKPATQTAIIRLYWKPNVTLIWIGAIIMFLGGLLSLLDRRLRQNLSVKDKTAKQPVIAKKVEV